SSDARADGVTARLELDDVGAPASTPSTRRGFFTRPGTSPMANAAPAPPTTSTPASKSHGQTRRGRSPSGSLVAGGASPTRDEAEGSVDPGGMSATGT